MKKLFLILAFVFVTTSVYGLTNSTLIDFSVTGDLANLQPAEGADANDLVPATNVYNDNWVVWLNDSARLIENRRLSYVTNVESKGNDGVWPAGKVLGVRVHYPIPAWNSYALVKPRFELEMYGGKYTEKKGVITNIGSIKSVNSWVYGRNFLVSYFVNVKNELNEVSQFPMGNLYFSGWRQLTWNNRNYSSELYNSDLTRYPLYPNMMPSMKIDSLQFYRGKDVAGGNFISYVKDITIDYDIVVVEQPDDEDINEEATWQIMKTENDRRKEIESARIRETLEITELEKKRMQGGATTDTAAGTEATEEAAQ